MSKCKRFGCSGQLEQNIITGDITCTLCNYKEEIEGLFGDEEGIADLYGYEE